MLQAVFLASLFIGVGFVIAALFIARMNWRPDAEPYGRKTKFFKFAMHVDRYVIPQAVQRVRFLGGIGMMFFLFALLALVFKFFEDLAAR